MSTLRYRLSQRFINVFRKSFAHYRVVANIDAAGQYFPRIACEANDGTFDGTFDGNGLSFSNAMLSGGSFFRKIGSRGTVTDFTLNGCELPPGTEMAPLCMENAGSVTGCAAILSPESGKKLEAMSIGGLVYKNSGAIQDCYTRQPMNVHVLQSSFLYCGAGGLAYENTGRIRNSYSTGSISYLLIATSESAEIAAIARYGGIAAQNSGQIENCYYGGKVPPSGEYKRMNGQVIFFPTGGLNGITTYGGTDAGLRNCYFLSENIDEKKGYEDTGSAGLIGYAASYMKSGAFKDLLNFNRQAGWSSWNRADGVNEGFPFHGEGAAASQPNTTAVTVPNSSKYSSMG